MNDAKKALIRSIRLTLSSLSCLNATKPSLSPPPTKIYVSSILDPDPVSKTHPSLWSYSVNVNYVYSIAFFIVQLPENNYFSPSISIECSFADMSFVFLNVVFLNCLFYKLISFGEFCAYLSVLSNLLLVSI